LNLSVIKIISGGQTGADRAAFDFALENEIEMGGFVPLGRRAEDGPIPGTYPNLTETGSRDYQVRTELNIINSDATLILSHGALTGGSLLTRQLAELHQKPFLHLNLAEDSMSTAILKTKDLLRTLAGRTLNIAGPRKSEDPEIYQKTKDFLTLLFD
jgi:hypothetical protein